MKATSKLSQRREKKITLRIFGVRLDCFQEQSLAARRPMKAKECLLSKREDDGTTILYDRKKAKIRWDSLMKDSMGGGLRLTVGVVGRGKQIFEERR